MLTRHGGARGRDERVVQQSGLDWTLVRPPRLADGPAVPARVGRDCWVGPFASISRDTLASVLVDAAEGRWSLQGVTVLPEDVDPRE